MTNENVAPALRPTAGDHAATGLNYLTSAVDVVAPGMGSFFGSLIGQVIPNQRNERLLEYVTRLSRRLRVLEEQIASAQEGESASVHLNADGLGAEQRALFEDGAAAAIRATSDERVERIAQVVADGLAGTETAASEQRRLLELLNELSEEDVVVLCAYTVRYGQNTEWRERHSAALKPTISALNASQETLDKDTMRQLRTQRLLRLGVIEEKPSSSGRSTQRGLTRIGRFVLRRLGLLEERQA